MQLKTGDKAIFTVEVEPRETLIIKRGGVVGLTIGTMETSNGHTALTIAFPKEKLYRAANGSFVLCSLGGYERITFGYDDSAEVVELRRIE